MLNVFNRSELFMTYTKENVESVVNELKKHGIEYIVKTTKIHDEYTDEYVKGTKNGKAYDFSIAYKVYVQKSDFDIAHQYVRKALFPND